MPYLLDTDWAIQALGGRQPATGILHRLMVWRIGISWVTLAEVYDAAFLSPNPQASMASLRRFLSSYRILPPTDPIAERFAELRSTLRRRGERLPDFDLVIAATALHHGLTLLTFNRRHFARIPDLRLFEPPHP